jgi:hypothetical protein
MTTAASPPPPRRADRFVTWYLWVTAGVQAVLVVIVIILLIQNNSLGESNQRNITAQHTSNIQQCQLANVTRIQDIAIWNRLLKVSPTSAAAKAEIAELNHLVKVKDTPRNCVAAYPGG